MKNILEDAAGAKFSRLCHTKLSFARLDASGVYELLVKFFQSTKSCLTSILRAPPPRACSSYLSLSFLLSSHKSEVVFSTCWVSYRAAPTHWEEIMDAEDLFVGVDVGTGSARAALVTRQGRVLATASREIKIWTPKPGYAEQSSQDIWNAVCEATRVYMIL